MRALQLILSVLLFVTATHMAWPQERDQRDCLPLSMMVAKLEHDYHESGIMTGVNQTGAFVILFARDDLSTWTSVVVNPRTRLACITSIGTDLVLIYRQQAL